MRIAFYFLIALLLAELLPAQELSKEEILLSNKYYTGSSINANEAEAFDLSVKRLVEGISISIQSSMTRKIVENNNNVSSDIFSQIVSTYSAATLQNLQKLVRITPNGIEVFVFIKKENVEKIFDERKKLAYDIFVKANDLEKESGFGYALKYYYFALVLMNSIPAEQVIVNGKNMSVEIPERINAILQHTNFTIVSDRRISDKEREICAQIQTFGRPANYFEFTVWDGKKQINIAGQDGKYFIRLMGASVDFRKLDVAMKYSFYECRDEIKAVGDLWNLVNKPAFKNSQQIDLEKQSTETKDTKSFPEGTISKVFKRNGIELVLHSDDPCDVLNAIGESAQNVIQALNRKNGPEAMDNKKIQQKLSQITRFNGTMLTGNAIDATVNKTADGWELRKIPVANEYSSINLQMTESLVMDYSSDGQLEDLSFSVTESMHKKYVEENPDREDRLCRQTIVKFLERYRTAYLTRDIATINTLFADSAVIIIGKVLRTVRNTDEIKYSPLNAQQPDVQYLRLTKSQYLKNQTETFNRAKDIYLGFSTFKIMAKNNVKGVYGVSLRQHYYSTGYKDEGYLFLLIDFDDVQPKIYVRSWQPQEWDSKKIVELANFRILK